MKRLRSLEAAAVSGNVSIQAILHIALGVAEEIGDREAARWLNEEMRGYAFLDRVPDYRRVLGDAGMTVDHAWREFAWLDDDHRRDLSLWPLQQAAPHLEKLATEAVATLKPLDRSAVAPHVRDEIPAKIQPELRISSETIRAVLTNLRRRIHEWAASISDPDVALTAQPPRNNQGRANEVFIVHGQNHAVRDRIDLFLTKELGLKTVVMEAGAMRGMTIPEKFEAAAERAAFAVFIITADDVLSSQGKQVRRARQNVVLEIGYFWGLLGRRDRVAFLVEDHPEMELPSDLQGIGWIVITPDLGSTKQQLRNELVAAGVATT